MLKSESPEYQNVITSGIGSLRKTNEVTRLCLLPFSLAFLLERQFGHRQVEGRLSEESGDEDPKMPQKKTCSADLLSDSKLPDLQGHKFLS